MNGLLLDTNVVSILYKPSNTLHERCFDIVRGQEWMISFMTRSELLLWPKANNWGSKKREELEKLINLCTTLYADDEICVLWADISAARNEKGHPISTADAWVAAT